MNIAQIVNELKFVDSSSLIMCKVEKAGINSRVDAIGQLKTNVPGAYLGEREPYQREKSVGELLEELATFGSNFQSKDFLLGHSHEVDDENYELRYFELSRIEISEGQLVLVSTDGELLDLRELTRSLNLNKATNKRMLHQPLRGLDGFSARASLQNRRKCGRYEPLI